MTLGNSVGPVFPNQTRVHTGMILSSIGENINEELIFMSVKEKYWFSIDGAVKSFILKFVI